MPCLTRLGCGCDPCPSRRPRCWRRSKNHKESPVPQSRTLIINGESKSVDVPDDMPLLWVLRDVLGGTGPNFASGIPQCGACPVHLDGKPMRSCVLPVSAVGARAVTTIEA